MRNYYIRRKGSNIEESIILAKYNHQSRLHSFYFIHCTSLPSECPISSSIWSILQIQFVSHSYNLEVDIKVANRLSPQYSVSYSLSLWCSSLSWSLVWFRSVWIIRIWGRYVQALLFLWKGVYNSDYNWKFQSCRCQLAPESLDRREIANDCYKELVWSRIHNLDHESIWFVREGVVSILTGRRRSKVSVYCTPYS